MRAAPHHPVRRILPVLAIAASTLGLAACIPLAPPIDSILPPEPPAPLPTQTQAAPEPSATDGVAAGELPDLVAIGAELPEGALAGWQTSLVTDPAFAPQPESDFPVGPTISVVETATGCTFWAYQGLADEPADDEQASSEATLAALTDSSPSDWTADVVTLGPSAEGTSVDFLSVVSDFDDGSVEGVFARAYAGTATAQSIVANCPADAGGVDHIDEVVAEHLQVSFQLP